MPPFCSDAVTKSAKLGLCCPIMRSMIWAPLEQQPLPEDAGEAAKHLMRLASSAVDKGELQAATRLLRLAANLSESEQLKRAVLDTLLESGSARYRPTGS